MERKKYREVSKRKMPVGSADLSLTPLYHRDVQLNETRDNVEWNSIDIRCPLRSSNISYRRDAS